MRKMRNDKPAIGLVGAFPYPHSQGSQVLVSEQCRYLVDAGYRVLLFVYNLGGDSSGLGEGPDAGPVLVRPPALPGYRKMRAGPSLGKPFQDALLYREVRRAVKSGAVDLLHAHNYEAGLITAAAARGSGIPWLYQPHGLLGEELPFYFGGSMAKRSAGRAGAAFDTIFPRRAGMVVCMHRGLADTMVKAGVPEDRIRIIPPAVNLEDFGAAAPDAAPDLPGRAGERSGDVAREPPFIVYTGNLDRYQNLPLLAESLAFVTASVPSARLAVVTESDPADLLSLAPLYRRRAEAAGNSDPVPFEEAVDFHLTGDFGAILKVLTAARVAVSPREAWSGFPVKIVNYLAAGLPVVASAGSVRFIGSREGILVPEDPSPRSFAAALVRFLEDGRYAAGVSRAAYASARDRFSWEAVGPDLEAAYEYLLKQRFPSPVKAGS